MATEKVNQAMLSNKISLRKSGALLLSTSVIALLSACGGSSNSLGNSVGNSAGSSAGSSVSAAQSTSAPADITTGVTVFGMAGANAVTSAAVTIQPTYHLAAVLPEPPDGLDAGGMSLSRVLPPSIKQIPEEAQQLPTRQMRMAQLVRGTTADISAHGATGTTATYSPAQVRAAYGLATLPSSFSNLSAAQLAQYGAGQTIYLIDAYDDPMVASELGAFSQLFGLPACTTRSLPVNASLPLAAPSANGCDFYKVQSSNAGSMTATVPKYDANWAVEIAMDVQWAHAIAPLARLVLIESADATVPTMSGAIGLANLMGPGVVSMSFGGTEGSYVLAADSYFQSKGMSYFASTGDSGAGVSWPSSSPYVVAVGGTTLTYSGTGSRSEVVWSKTGGGVSAFEPTPLYQNNKVPGMQNYGKRAVADVSFNADPNSGQYVAVIPNQATCSFCQVSWVTGGGTSLSTPQWAGLTAIVNAMRTQAGKPMLGDPHAALYTQIASTASTYASVFADVTTGSDASCAICSATRGYDAPSGLGSPNAAALINTLTGLTVASAPAVRGGISISAIAGKALSFNVSVTASNAYTMSLQNAPAGMSVSSNAVVSWATPVVGNYTVNVVATDSKTGLSGQGVYSVFVAGSTAPVVSSGSQSGTAGQPLSFPIHVTDVNPTTVTLSGAPSGMSISSAGLISWSLPVAGTYSVTVTARDMMNNLTGNGVYAVTINKTPGPVVSSGNVTGSVGTALKFAVAVTDPNPYTLSLPGAPTGMTIDSKGNVSWPTPVLGNYTVSVVARDNASGLTGTGTYNISIGTAGGPSISGSGLSGKVGTPLNGTIQISDSTSSIAGVGVGGMPVGMNVNAVGGMTQFSVTWAKPVAGTYVLQVFASDAAQRSTSANLIVTISN
ncbi:hypothetical protein AAKU58_000377 [Oxalobacteraceae bacterium GrIS 1.18]